MASLAITGVGRRPYARQRPLTGRPVVSTKPYWGSADWCWGTASGSLHQEGTGGTPGLSGAQGVWNGPVRS